MISVDSTRAVCPLFQTEEGGSIPASTLQIIFEQCPRKHAAALNREWHSRLPEIQWRSIKYAFHGRYGDLSYAVALWSHPVTNMLPVKWLELRRLAIAPDAPKNTASAFIGWMVRWLRKNHPAHERLISYQDTVVHAGTIYKAAGWECTGSHHQGGACGWNNNVRHRSEDNGIDPLKALKVRWEKVL